MIRLGENIFTFVKIVIGIGSLFVLFSCGVKRSENFDQAPFHVKMELIESWGEENRRQTGRSLSEKITHPESAEPLTIASEAVIPPGELISLKPAKIELEVAETKKRSPKLAPIQIAINETALEQILRSERIELVNFRARSGRLHGQQNVVQINFVPKAFSDRAIFEEFLTILTIVNASQTSPDTIDFVRCIAENDDGSPKMLLESAIADYLEFVNQKIDRPTWESRLKIDLY